MSEHTTNNYRALLFDLDGTLLGLDIEKFVPAYIEALSEKFTGYIEKNDFARFLFEATNIMVRNRDPLKNNETVFYEEFCRLTEQPFDRIKPVVDSFYRDVFPKLSYWGEELPYARAVVEKAKHKHLTLVLATNPIFPAAAILQRLSWSGLSKRDFSLVTTMENMHFCKPNPEYYQEISQQINCSPENCLMVGNDTLEDLSASETGMDTFLVEDCLLDRGSNSANPTYRGSLKELATFIDKLEPGRT